MKCRHCGSELTLPLVDLGSAPPANAYLTGHSEAGYGLTRADGYANFQSKSDAVKDGFLRFLLEARHHGKKVAAYGAGGLWTASRQFSPPRIPQPSFMREVGLCES